MCIASDGCYHAIRIVNPLSGRMGIAFVQSLTRNVHAKAQIVAKNWAESSAPMTFFLLRLNVETRLRLTLVVFSRR